jgi:beta-lactamase regulating signal transducer with metallopeptidase domain
MTTLVAWLWQGTALALLALLLLRVMRSVDAATRHALWWGVLGAILALPCLPSMDVLIGASTAAVPQGAARGAGFDAPLLLPAPPEWLVAAAIGAWLGFVLLGGLRIARGLAFIQRLVRSAEPLDTDRERRLVLWTSSPCTRPVALLVSPLVRTACAMGLGRPAIVLPPSLIDAVDDDTLDQIVMHERAHLERYDDAWRLAEAVVDAVAGLHPGVRIALGQIEAEREAACDDRVVLLIGAADRYAASLADAASCAAASGRRRQPRLLPTAVSRRSALVSRVARLLDGTRRRSARVTPAAALAGVLVLGSVAAAASRLDPVVAFEARVLQALAPAVSVSTEFRAEAAPEAERTPTPVPARRSRPRTAQTADEILQTPTAPADPQSSVSASPIRGADRGPDAPVPSRSLDVPTAEPVAVLPGTRVAAAGVPPPRSPWMAAADGGTVVGGAARRGSVAVGSGVRKAGTSVAGFFARAGRAVGKSF